MHRGYVLASGLCFATELRLSAAQLVALGTVVGRTLLTADVPGGVWSDAVSRSGARACAWAARRRARSIGLVFRRGVRLERGNPEILRMLAATMLLNGAGVVTWLFPRRLVDAGFPGETVLWYRALGILSFATGAAALRLVELRIDGAGTARRSYRLGCLVGSLGLALLARTAGSPVTLLTAAVLVAATALLIRRPS